MNWPSSEQIAPSPVNELVTSARAQPQSANYLILSSSCSRSLATWRSRSPLRSFVGRDHFGLTFSSPWLEQPIESQRNFSSTTSRQTDSWKRMRRGNLKLYRLKWLICYRGERHLENPTSKTSFFFIRLSLNLSFSWSLAFFQKNDRKAVPAWIFFIFF